MTNHIKTQIAAAVKAAREAQEKNEAKRTKLLEEQAAADQALVENLEALNTLVRAVQEQHADEAAPRNLSLAQATRIANFVAGVESEPVASQPSAREEELAALRKQVSDNNERIAALASTAEKLLAQRVEAASAAPAPQPEPQPKPVAAIEAPTPTPEPDAALEAAPEPATDEVFDTATDKAVSSEPAVKNPSPTLWERFKAYANEKKVPTTPEGSSS